MYPAYTVQGVLDLYAITFFTLLNDGYRIRAKHYLMLTQIANHPGWTQTVREEFMRRLEWSASDPADILKPSDDYSGIEQAKDIFRNT